MKKLFLIAALCCAGIIGYAQQQLAFPEAEGFGKYAVGGRGGKVIKVTTLEDYMPAENTAKNPALAETPIEGSLRWALEQHKYTQNVYRDETRPSVEVTVFEPLTILFDVCGTIWLKDDLKIKRDSLTIAGQSAPCGGICIAGRSVLFNGATGGESWYYGPRRKELIVRHIRFRPGIPKDANGVPTTSFVTYAVDMENYENVIFDHCSMSWANEECLATYDTKNVTFQYNIVSEGLYNAYHSKGTRSYGGVWGGQFATYHHNLIAHNASRTARFNGARAHDTIAVVEYRNNVIYNWATSSDAACGGEATINHPATRAELNIFNNYYKRGPAITGNNNVGASNKAHRIVQLYGNENGTAGDRGKLGNAYVIGNFVATFPTVTANNWNYGVQFKDGAPAGFPTDTASRFTGVRLNTYSPEVIPFLPNNTETAEQAFDQVVANCGATLPKRDAIDARVLNETRNGTATGSGSFGTSKGIIDDPETVGGWADLTCSDTPKLDSDNDGMPDEWELANSLNENNPDDRNNIAPSGYTMLEEYLNTLIPPVTRVKEAREIEGLRVYPNPVENELFVETAEPLQTIAVYALSGQLVEKTSNTNISTTTYLPGIYSVEITAQSGNKSVVKIMKK
ncbi:MAG: T9SS type A sorting domain-containing protein [Prevotellaceae bacterium]|jgi:hypothetical protein|nr:T9SS type A sorting domain-containing protein [Prevotellaceae bacterium]